MGMDEQEARRMVETETDIITEDDATADSRIIIPTYISDAIEQIGEWLRDDHPSVYCVIGANGDFEERFVLTEQGLYLEPDANGETQLYIL